MCFYQSTPLQPQVNSYEKFKLGIYYRGEKQRYGDYPYQTGPTKKLTRTRTKRLGFGGVPKKRTQTSHIIVSI